MKVSNPFKQS